MRQVVIASAVRTAVGSLGGTLRNIPAVQLGGLVIKEALRRARIRPEKVDQVLMGNVLQAGQGQNPARQAAANAGISQYTPAMTVNVVCGSGLESIIMAAQAIRAGDEEIIVAGGMESMSQAPFVLNQTRWGQRMGHGKLVDVLIHDGLWCAFGDIHMGITAENVANKFHLSREEQDRFALESQRKAEQAIKSGRFKDEIVPVEVPQRKGDPIIFDTDEFPKFGTSMEKLGKLRPAFKKDGTVTAGNSSGVNDGAGALVVMSEEKAIKMGVRPLARIVSYDSEGCEPELMGMGPIYAVRTAVAKAKEALDKPVELVELNEAFAAQSIACLRELDLNTEIVNVNGGAIAIGHPIGCSGTRIMVSLLYEMQKRDAKVGLAALCVGGGMGFTMIVERSWYF